MDCKKTLLIAGVPLLFFFCSDLLDTEGRSVSSPEAVTVVTPDHVYATGFTVRWSRAVSENFAAYHIYCDTQAGLDENSMYVRKLVYKNDTSFTFTDVSPGTRWFIKVRVYNGFTYSESNEISITTPACSCGIFIGQRLDGMVLIPAGCYRDSAGYSAAVSRDFYLDTTEVTEEEWAAIMRPDSLTSSRKSKVNINWFQAVLFCNKKSQLQNKDTCYAYSSITYAWDSSVAELTGLQCDFTRNGFRLPTEDEWEYAYTAGTSTDFYWGRNRSIKPDLQTVIYPVTAADSNEIGTYEWWSDNNTPDGPKEVGTKSPNPWKLYDMGGNISEFTWDNFGPRPKNRRLDFTGPAYDASSPWNEKVVRGGVFASPPECITADYRFSFAASGYTGSFGLRTACTAVQ